MSKIYILTTVRLDMKNNTSLTRSWGYFFDKKIALQCARNNVTDMAENGYYQYLIVTEKTDGLCKLDDINIYYVYNKSSNKFKREKGIPKGIQEYMKDWGMPIWVF